MKKLEIQGLKKKYNGKWVIKGIDLSINEKECVALIGPNGAGKSTMINMIVQILTQDEGQITIDGIDAKSVRVKIGFLPQYPEFYGWMSATECLHFMGKLSNMEKKDLETRIQEVLLLVGLEASANKKISTYSGGMRQRLGIAQAILHRPELLVLDEPVSALDPIGRREMMLLLDKLKKEITILFSTHILKDAEEICDRIAIIKNGELVADNTVSQLIKEESSPVFDVELNGDSDTWQKELLQNNYVEKIEKVGTVYQVFTTNQKAGAEAILSSLLNIDGEFIRVENRHQSLEEIFMEKVGK
ncbi:ABC transporter ATP-binding protein [Listeria cossartiae subsp. cayugensis]|uniref:ABC transporter ATP-binding protein n=1 Tax=Listeria cossartiae TaxID=2838249 RepID=UPI00288082AC|nr:ABC transporter ATP-binding protein [Listeria cossartiae]MDT0000532.1 ABC transporter ATP-binding protein [Listeria cossartiae subsp. cayugensis]MDT0008380.1 ABC transporter ATP-binding protein [Listeria cossartiae subsp. cayugensis]MDT0030212.1 ABC transporter ATP-binding protein [Listeria cossartiae subsp. cayugensis]MDT0038678.1 ABC transporter ATP-binding protein [Listeria cossartiae subsp. cayugensis]MDT0044029.1 ABC transporter ATP-binding protein [Listeria cossartiae subsp. cayugensi